MFAFQFSNYDNPALDAEAATLLHQGLEAGMAICVGEDKALMPYDKMTAIFETEHLWLLAYDGGKGTLLLQKKDLSSGDANAFSPYILQKICENT